MSGILGYSETCNSHNALRNISGYACGVTFSFKDAVSPPPDMHYAVVSLQECCAKAAAPVLRIPGNTGCEMQFCAVPEATSTRGGSSSASRTEVPTVGPPSAVENCLAFVYEGDLPDDVARDIDYAGSWCVVRMYDTLIGPEDERAAVTAAPAPPSWTSAAVDPWAVALSSESAASASASAAAATAKPTSSNGNGRAADQRTGSGVRIWAVAALVTLGFVAAL
ncbi:hypothetical protein F4819DRAFT_144091 [Hypoxylon fuscum]|nr:hypothetical protein F4819DRAFT_144091 [Hypoxylon fuscum]